MFVLLVAGCSVLQVHTPEKLEGQYADASVTAHLTYSVHGHLTVAATCPCQWDPGSVVIGADQLLLLTTGICANDCTAAAAICAASLANSSALLLSCGFDERHMPLPLSPPLPPPPLSTAWAEAAQRTALQCAQAANATVSKLSCPALSATQLSAALQLPAAFLAENASTELGVAAAGPSREGLGTLAAVVNVTLSSLQADDECEVYRHVPLVYVLLVPVWWLLTVTWVWNTYRNANAPYARDLHRLLCWVPVIQFVHGVLSLFNYSSCPWEGAVSLVYATFWAVITILKARWRKAAALPRVSLSLSRARARVPCIPASLPLRLMDALASPMIMRIPQEPVMLLCLLLVAKGWCITRNHLQRREARTHDRRTAAAAAATAATRPCVFVAAACVGELCACAPPSRDRAKSLLVAAARSRPRHSDAKPAAAIVGTWPCRLACKPPLLPSAICHVPASCRQVCLAGTVVALLYAAVSVQLSVQSVVSLVPMVLMYICILCDVVISIYHNLRILKVSPGLISSPSYICII